MPIPRNWSEELISECLQLLGYLAKIGVPLPGTGKRGRQEAKTGYQKRKRFIRDYIVEGVATEAE